MDNSVDVEKKLRELTSEFVNEVYLYVEEHGIKKDLVKISTVPDKITLQIQPEVPEHHKEELEKLAAIFGKKVKAFWEENEANSVEG